MDIIPGSFAFQHVNQMATKARIIKVLELGYIYLWHAELKLSVEVTPTILRKPRVHEVILLLEIYFERFRVIHDYEEIKAWFLTWMCSPQEGALPTEREGLRLSGMKWLTLSQAKSNNPEEWWSVNDFEILCASYRCEVDGCLKTVSPYFARGSKSDGWHSRTAHPVWLHWIKHFRFQAPCPTTC